MKHSFQARLLREYQDILRAQLPGIDIKPPVVVVDVEDDDYDDDVVEIEPVTSEIDLIHYNFYISFKDHFVYHSNFYQLSIEVTDEYPFGPPIVKFVGKIPIHPHVYLNGHICLNILGDDWTPACTLQSCVLSIQSMLNNNTVNERPPDDSRYVRSAPANPLRSLFYYHEEV